MKYLENPGNQIVRQTLQLRERTIGYTSVLDYPAELHPLAHAAMIASNVNFVLLHAEEARREALSYRGFRVGAAALAVYRQEEQLRTAYVHGANAKPVEGSDIINIHAEHTIFSMVEAGQRPGEQTYHVPLLGVIGDLQADQQSGTSTATLHPCGVCREMTFEKGSVIDERSLMVTTTPDFRVVEWFSRGALARLHDHGDDSGIGRAQFDSRPAMLTLPEYYLEAERERKVLHLADYDDAEADEEAEYNEKVRDPIIQYVLRMCRAS